MTKSSIATFITPQWESMRLRPTLQRGHAIERLDPKEKDSMSETTTSVHLLDATGHTTVQMTRQEVMNLPGVSTGERWVFMDSKMVEASQIADTDFGAVTNVMVGPALAAG